MTWRLLVGLVCAAATGFTAAQVLAQNSRSTLLPTVTVTTPSLPAPTVTTPVTTATVSVPTPTVTVPPPLPTASLPPPPTVTVPKPAPTVTIPKPLPTVTVTVPVPPPVTTAPPPPAGVPSGSVPAGTAPARARPGPAAPPRSGQGGGGAPQAESGADTPRAANTAEQPDAAAPAVSGPQSAGHQSGVTSPGGRGSSFTLSDLGVARVQSRSGRAAVWLRFTLPARARVRFLVFGPAPSCRLAGSFAITGRQGRNKLRFDGRLGKRLLKPGLYTIVPRMSAVVTGHVPQHVAVQVDARGARPTRALPRTACPGASTASQHIALPDELARPGVAPPSSTVAILPRAFPPAAHPDQDGSGPSESSETGFLASFGDSTPRLALIILPLLAVSLALLALASVPPRLLPVESLRPAFGQQRLTIAAFGLAFMVTAAVVLALALLSG